MAVDTDKMCIRDRKLEEKMGEKLEELREDNQILREELREVNQENLDKLDERMELLREELNKEILSLIHI